jgi:hypothetical protein
MRQLALAPIALLAACDRANGDAASAPDDAAAPAEATEVAQTCEQFEGYPDEPKIQHRIPATLASFVSATETTITVKRDSGTPACLDVSYGDVDAWDSLAEGRLLGVGISGHEYNSYLVVDRDGTGEPIETGRAPIFSPSGRRFASVDVSEAAFGAFEALGVWEITDGSIKTLAGIEDLLDRGNDWRLVGWASEDCIIFSTAADGTDPELRERAFHELRLTARPELKDVDEEQACR